MTPAGAKSLSTVKRPDGRSQVAYKGGPLYTFAQDRKPGDMKGNGFKDVGTWRVVTVSGQAAPASSAAVFWRRVRRRRLLIPHPVWGDLPGLPRPSRY